MSCCGCWFFFFFSPLNRLKNLFIGGPTKTNAKGHCLPIRDTDKCVLAQECVYINLYFDYMYEKEILYATNQDKNN